MAGRDKYDRKMKLNKERVCWFFSLFSVVVLAIGVSFYATYLVINRVDSPIYAIVTIVGLLLVAMSYTISYNLGLLDNPY